MCLPLLPSDRIIEMFNYLKMNRPDIPESENEKMKKLLKHYQRYWSEQIGSSRLSVFQNNKSTTNDLESFHANLERKFCSHKANYWNLVKKMNKVIKATEKDMERIDNNITIRRTPSLIALHKKQVIYELQGKLIRGEIKFN